MGGPGGSAPADGRSQIDYYTGEFGTRFLESLESRIMDGKFGDTLKDFESPPSAGAGRGGPGMGMPGMAPGGLMAPVGGAGAIGGPMGDGPPGAGGAAGAAGSSKDPKGILPGLVMLGVGSSKDWLERRAKDQTLDLLFIFEVKIAQSLKTEIVNNTTTLKLYAVQKPAEVVFTTAAINAVGVTKAREKVKDKDPVDNEVERMMNVLEKGAGDGKLPFVVTGMPALQPEHAMRRVNLITASQSAAPLAHLVEIRAFKAMRLISGQQYQDGVKGLIGPEKAETLLKTDKEADAKVALASFLPRKGRR